MKGVWTTVLKDIIPGRDLTLFDFICSRFRHRGFPKDFKVVLKGGDPWHEDIWMGESGFGWCTLDDFVTQELPETPLTEACSIEQHKRRVYITIDEAEDPYYNVRCLQKSFRILFGDSHVCHTPQGTSREGLLCYRLVFGFDY